MINLADRIESALTNPPEYAVIGEFGWGGYPEDDPNSKRVPEDQQGILLTWAQARPLLDYDYDSGYGSPECHAVYVWSRDQVAWLVDYDGSTSVRTAPTQPTSMMPHFS